MQRTYAFLPQDTQQVLLAAGGTITNHPSLPMFGEEKGGLWTVLFPEVTTVDECYLWTPEKTTYHRYSMPGDMILVEPQDEGNSHRSLLLLTPLMQNEYGMSRKEVLQGYPRITVTAIGVKEILVPAHARGIGDATSIFLNGFGGGRPGFRPIFVLFTYRADGQREIYLIEHDEVEHPAQRYAHLHELIPAPNPSEQPAPFWESSLDGDLKQTYGIDWEQEIAQRRAPLSQESPPMTASPPGSDDPVIVKKAYYKTYEKDECYFALMLYGTKTPRGYAGERILHLIWQAEVGEKWRFTRLMIEDTDMEILADSQVLRQLAVLFSEDIDIDFCEIRLKELGFVQEQH